MFYGTETSTCITLMCPCYSKTVDLEMKYFVSVQNWKSGGTECRVRDGLLGACVADPGSSVRAALKMPTGPAGVRPRRFLGVPSLGG